MMIHRMTWRHLHLHRVFAYALEIVAFVHLRILLKQEVLKGRRISQKIYDALDEIENHTDVLDRKSSQY